MKKKFLVVLTGASLLMGGMSIGVFASSHLQEIKANLNTALKVRVNGEIAQMNDVNGNAVLPITYKGSTYLPIRAVSNLLDVAVHYDEEAYEVILGELLEGVAVNQELFDEVLYSKDPAHTNYADTDYKEVLYSSPDKSYRYTAFTPDGKYQKLYLQFAALEKDVNYIEIRDVDTNALLKEVGVVTPEDGMQTIEVDIAGVETVTVNVGKESGGGFVIPLTTSYFK
ncbi:copper amine oxidase N-terminal domain-containing protein [Paenibacillus sp. J5C_2022]|nr:copper amine oxidase N-terminal domain-containing protein [Paenibacillus sp. J5C2022]